MMNFHSKEPRSSSTPQDSNRDCEVMPSVPVIDLSLERVTSSLTSTARRSKDEVGLEIKY